MANNDQPAQQKPIRITDLNSVLQSFKQVWNGLNPTGWFSPGQPVEPVQPEPEPRQRQVPVGSNLQYIPRGTEATSFEQLRFFYTNYDVAGICVQTRIEQLQGIEWSIVAKGDSKGDAAKTKTAAGDKYKNEINIATEFFNKPDGKHKWPIWLRMVLEQRLVLDAVTLWPRPTRGGQLYGLDVIDGATIKPLVDIRGAIPDPPAPALQQILFGMPRGIYTDGGPILGDPAIPKGQRLIPLLYLPQNVRAHSVYGYPEIEKVMLIVNTALRKRMQDLAHFTDGNIPRALVGVPKEWTAEQIKKYQEYWDEMMAGDLTRRSRIFFTSTTGGAGGVSVKEFVEFNGNPEFDLWLLKLTCAALRMTPTEIGFTDDVNRATSEEQGNIQNRSSIKPLTQYVKGIGDQTLDEYLGMPFLEMQFQLEEQVDEVAHAQATKLYVDMGALQPDEVRADLGRKPYGIPPFIMTTNGPILIDQIAEMGQAKLEGAKNDALGNFGPQGPNTPGGTPKPRASGQGDPKGNGTDDGDATYGTDKSVDTCCTDTIRKAQRYVWLESDGVEKSGVGAEYNGVDIEWHQTFCDALKSPELGEPYPGALDAIQQLLDNGYTVYLSCGGLGDPDTGAELQQRMRNHLLMHGIDPDQGIVFRAKPRTIAVVDDRAIQFNGDWSQTLQHILSSATRQKSATECEYDPDHLYSDCKTPAFHKFVAAGAVIPAVLASPFTPGRATKMQAGYVDQKGIGGCLNCMWFDPVKQGCKVVGDTPASACCNYWNSDPAPEGLSKEEAGWVNVPGAAYLCNDCIFFDPDRRTCGRVYGEIEPNGSCNLWEPAATDMDVLSVINAAPVVNVMGEPGRTTGQLSTDGDPTRKAAYQLARDDLRRWRIVVQKCVKSNQAIRPFNSEHIPEPVRQAVLSELDNLTKFGAPNRPQFVTSVFAKALKVLEQAE